MLSLPDNHQYLVLEERQGQLYEQRAEGEEREEQGVTPAVAPAPSAVDPFTGEINWDCPCLKDAIAPPCGEHFKAAFSCFVRSETIPKGEDCMDLFVVMQQCYLAHPEVYQHMDQESKESEIEEKEKESI